jgi:hypothetical protein
MPTVLHVKVPVATAQVDPDGSEPRRRLRFGPIVFGLAAAVAVVVVASAGFESVNDQARLDTQDVLSQQLTGIGGTLQMLVERGTDTFHMAWQPDRPRAAETLLQIGAGRLNADGTSIGGLGRTVPDLWVGTSETITVVNPDTLSFVWHDTDPGRLAAVRNLGGDFRLWLGEQIDDGTWVFSTLAGVGGELSVAAYGDWGVAVHTKAPTGGVFFVQVFDLDGTEVVRRTGRVLGSLPGPDGGVVIDDESGSAMLLPGGEEIPLPVGARSLTWNSTGDLVAADVDGTTQVVDSAGAIVATAPGRPVRWVGQSRLLVAATNSLGYVDVAGDSVTSVEVNGTIVDAIVGG